MNLEAETNSPKNGGVAVVILAGGIGSRMQAGQNKVYLQIEGRHMLSFSLATASSSSNVNQIVLVVRDEDRELAEGLAAPYLGRMPIRITSGGASRQDSEYRGVSFLRDEIDAGTIDVVAVHDGARPFVSLGLLDRVIGEARAIGGAIAATAVDDQLYDKEAQTLINSRGHFWAQTPQAFKADILLASHDAAAQAAYSGVDTAEVVQAFSDQRVGIVEGENSNIKITFASDLSRATALAQQWSESASYIETVPPDEATSSMGLTKRSSPTAESARSKN